MLRIVHCQGALQPSGLEWSGLQLCVSPLQRRIWGQSLAGYFLYIRYEIASETILGSVTKMMILFGGQTTATEFYMYALSVHCAGSIGFRSFAYFSSHTLRRRGLRDQSFAWMNGKLSEEILGRVFFRTVCSHCSRFDMSPVCLGALCWHLPSGSAKQPLVRKKVVQLKRECGFSFWQLRPLQ